MNHKILILTITILVMAAACLPLPVSDADDPVSSDDIPIPTPTVDYKKYELAESVIIESVDPMFLESFPLQVHVLITGSLPDGCTTVYRTESTREEDQFTVRIFTLRERDAMCTQALVPFDASVPLDVYGLPANTYRVMVYDFNTEFTFTQDNIIQDSESGN